jgi:tetratricopeptide (TPR) repeat protein
MTDTELAEQRFASGRLSEARILYERAVEQGAGTAQVLFRLAAIANDEGRFEDARTHAARAVAMSPGEADYRYLLGRIQKNVGQFAAAEEEYREALRLRPGDVGTWISLGVLLRQQGRATEAERCQREALRLEPRNMLAHLSLGNALYSQVRVEEAAACFRAALELDPASVPAHLGLGQALLALHDVQAAAHFAVVLTADPNHYEAALALGKTLVEGQAHGQAAEAFRLALRIQPDSREAAIKLVTSCFHDRQLQVARAECERLIQRYPDWDEPLAVLAMVLRELGQSSQPRALYEQLLARDPDSPQARAQYSLMLIRQGDFARGWDYYESRWPGALPRGDAFERPFLPPRWNGEPLADKTLLITREQGLGDELLFASIIPDMLRVAAACVIECDRRLEPLFRRSFAGATVVGVDHTKPGELEAQLSTLPAFDYWTPIGSLPRYRRRTAPDFPRHQGYLSADAERSTYWRRRLDDLGRGLKIGLSWSGGTRLTGKRTRSLSLDDLLPVLTTGGVRWVSVQYGDRRAEVEAFAKSAGVEIHHWQEAVDDYDETAALVSALDMVISVCTSIVNLGGALNRPVWVLTPLVPDPRYGWQGSSSIWYPSLRIFRQTRPDEWRPVIADTKRALRKLLQDVSHGGEAQNAQEGIISR